MIHILKHQRKYLAEFYLFYCIALVDVILYFLRTFDLVVTEMGQ